MKRLSDKRSEMLNALKEHEPARAPELAQRLDKPASTVRSMLSGMVRDGICQRVAKGEYATNEYGKMLWPNPVSGHGGVKALVRTMRELAEGWGSGFSDELVQELEDSADRLQGLIDDHFGNSD